MITQNGIAPFVAFRYERIILRPFHALRQPVQVTACRRAFFYLWKGVKEYEPEVHLPRLWDTLGL